MSKVSKKALTITLLLTLMVSAFFIRLENYKRAQARAIDEIVYLELAKELTNDFPSYHVLKYGQHLSSQGRELPDYFFKPLFKHPPLFSLLSSISMRLFGTTMLSVEYVSLLFGVLLIPLTFALGSLLFSRKVGYFAAFMNWIDPITIINSQKAWMETTLSFFTVLAIYCFAYALKRKKDSFFILAGIATGLATLTKYPGILPLPIMALYAAFWQRDLFKNKSFHMALALPFLLLIPWGYWNFSIYGTGFFTEQADIHNVLLNNSRTLQLIGLALLVVVGIFLKLKKSGTSFTFSPQFKNRCLVIGATLFIMFTYPSIIKSLSLDHLPHTSWAMGWLGPGNHNAFYFTQLIEFNLFYLIAFAACFINTHINAENKRLLFLSIAIIFTFYILWGSFQSRYILANIPLLLVLGSGFVFEMIERFEKLSEKKWLFEAGYITTTLGLIYILGKTVWINFAVSFPHDMCYF